MSRGFNELVIPTINPITEFEQDQLADTVMPSVKALKSAATLRRVARVLPEFCRKVHSGDMVNTFSGANGLGAGSTRPCS